jgi:hypothetical protein
MTEESEFDSRQVQDIFLFYIASRLSLGSDQLSLNWLRGSFTPGGKRPRSEADHSLPSNTEVTARVFRRDSPGNLRSGWAGPFVKV